MGGIDYLRNVAVPTMSAAAQSPGRPAPRFVAMVPILFASNVATGRDQVNAAFQLYGQIPSYRATLDRGGAAMPADVAIIGNAAAIEAGLQAYADVGVTDFVAVVPREPAAAAQATTELLSGLAKARNSA
jgi:alkanesulfonate monooxygenase SsuD/methylene tetrahydromethanopterin reductase-like flavin-dependent oxidoreductase (luciferase family)